MNRFLSFAALVAAVIFTSGYVSFGASPSVVSPIFTPQAVRPGNIAVYELTIKNMTPELNLSDIPVPSGLTYVGKSQSSSFSMGTGTGVSRSISIRLSFLAEKEGTFSIPEWNIRFEGKNYPVTKATLKVDTNAPAQIQSAQSSLASMPNSARMGRIRQAQANQSANSQMSPKTFTIDGKLKLSIETPRKFLYVGESAPCELIFSFDRELIARGFKLSQLAPNTENADEFECAGFKPDKPEIDTSDPDRIFVKYKFYITPIKTGTYPLDFKAEGVFLRETSLEDMMNMSIFDRMMSMNEQYPFQLSADAKNIEVRALPTEGRPVGFTGAIGNFKIDSLTVNPESLTVDEPCTLTLKISGEGNFTRISQPYISKSPDWKIYKFKSSFFDESGGAAHEGIKTFEAPLVPLKADITALPSVDLSFFNPTSNKYEILKATTPEVSVAPSLSYKRKVEVNSPSASAQVAEKTLSGIVETPAKSLHSSFLSSGWFWVLQTVILAAFVAFIYSRRKKIRLATDPLYAKLQSSKMGVKRELNLASKCANIDKAKDFFIHARSAIQWALSPNTDADSTTILLGEAREILRKKDMEELTGEVAVYFDGADAIVYGALNVESLDFNKLLNNLKTICDKIEHAN